MLTGSCKRKRMLQLSLLAQIEAWAFYVHPEWGDVLETSVGIDPRKLLSHFS